MPNSKQTGAPSPYLVTVAEDTRSAAIHHSPSAARNTGPILEVLSHLLPSSGQALEIASGTGQHAIAFAGEFPAIHWTPSDPDQSARASIVARTQAAGLGNLSAPLNIDLTVPDWHRILGEPVDAIAAINVVHISPWEATLGLLKGAAATLGTNGLVYIYSCFSRDGGHLSESNIAFDRSLKSRNPAWGVRDTRDVTKAAEISGLVLEEIFEMPANNLSMAFRQRG